MIKNFGIREVIMKKHRERIDRKLMLALVVMNSLRDIKNKGGEKMKRIVSLSMLGLAIAGLISNFSWSFDEMEKNEYSYELAVSNEAINDDVAAVAEQKSYDYETAKTLTDMNGYRVRMEQYLSRPQSNQIKVEVYNSRDNGITTGYREDTYNQDLPTNLSDLVRQSGKPEWFITDRKTHVSNDTSDYYDHSLTGGWLFLRVDPDTYDVLYNEEKTSVSGKDKIDIIREGHNPDTNVEGYLAYWVPDQNSVLKKSFDSRVDFKNPLWLLSPYVYDATIIPDFEHTPTVREIRDKIIAGQPIDLHETNKLTFADGTFLSMEQAWIDDDGNILNTDTLKAAREEIRQGADWRDIVSKWNSEHIIGASEFSTRKIDILWSPQSFLAQVMSDREEE